MTINWGLKEGWFVPNREITLPPINISAEIPAEKVRWAQTILKKANGEYILVVDGILGPRTREAIERFQSAIGLTANSLIDQETTNALIQRGLNFIAKEERVAVDGKMNSITESEIMRFQSTHDSGPVDGSVGPITRAAMVRELSVMPSVVETHGGGLEVSSQVAEGWY